MKKIFLFSVMATFVCSISFATIRRIGYSGLPLTGVDYSSFADAHTAAANGDTIQVYGPNFSGTINKRLVVMGFGYNLDANPGLQVVATDAPSGISLTFGAGSDSSVIEGCSGNFTVGGYTAADSVDNVQFKRCAGTFIFNNYYDVKVRNIKIYSSVVHNAYMNYSAPPFLPVTNIQIYNSYINSVTLYLNGTTAGIINCVSTSPEYSGGNISFNAASVLVKNSMFNYTNISSSVNTVYENNFFYEAQPAQPVPGSNNRWGQRWSNLFNRLGGSSDQPGYYNDPLFDEDYFVLKAGSLAINGGFDAANQPTDCGIFGGEPAFRYKISGIPAVPAIYKLTAPSTAATTNPYNVTISVRSNN